MATNTYVALQTQTIAGSSTTAVTFNSIPQNYTDLVIVGNIGVSTSTSLSLLFNGGTTGNNSDTWMQGTGSSASSSRNTNASYFAQSNSSTVSDNFILNIMNYSNTTTNKTYLSRSNAAGLNTAVWTGLWSGTGATAAITSITLNINANLTSGSTFTLYGIAADTGSYTAQATGGTIAADQFWVYHAFTSSGTFTPSKQLNCDVLVVAGGGGGGNSAGASGGGGAGGVLAYTSQLLSSGTGYSVTVGSGGPKNSASDLQGSSGNNSQFASLTASIGGGGGAAYSAALTGGSGGGGGYFLNTNNGPGYSGAAGTSGQGYAGGAGYAASGAHAGGAGGGAGGVGGDASSGGPGGTGGPGINNKTGWGALATTLTALSLGSGNYIAGGGGGGAYNTAGSAGAGGGGAGGSSNSSINAGNGVVNTGSGGGGGAGNSASAGNGASGLVIVRYPR